MPEMLLLEQPEFPPEFSGEPNDILVDQAALQSDVDLWSNKSVVSDHDLPIHVPLTVTDVKPKLPKSPIKSILKS